MRPLSQKLMAIARTAKLRLTRYGLISLPAVSTLQSVGPASNVNPYNYNIIAKVEYWDDRRFSFTGAFSADSSHSTLLVQRREPITKQEIHLQRLIEGNVPRSYSLTERHLHRIQLRDEPHSVMSVRREPVRLLDRVDKSTLEVLQNFRYLISINQRFLLTEALRNVSDTLLTISIYTDDFDMHTVAFDQSFSDIIIAPDRTMFEGGEWPIRRFIEARSAESAYGALIDVLHEFAPKDFNVLAPIYGQVTPQHKVPLDNPKEHDIGIVLKGTANDAPPCQTSFRDYLQTSFTQESVIGILCTEHSLYRYKNIITRLPEDMGTLLEIALQDGARVGVWYEDDHSDI